MKKKYTADKITNNLTLGSTIIFIIFIISLLASLILFSLPSIKKFGLSFLVNDSWNVKFLELSNVRLQDNQLNFYFTVNISENVPPILNIYYNNTAIKYDYSINNKIVSINPSVSLQNGNIEIEVNPKLRDKNNKLIIDHITWSAELSNNKLENSIIRGKNLGIIEPNIQDENERHFAILAFIIGTVLSSLLALIMAFPVATAVALYLTEYSHPKSKFRHIFSVLIDLLAGIPSVIYGLWGLFLLVPKFGANLFTASLVLAIMIIPYTASLTSEAISLVPKKIKDAGLGLGASHFQVIWKVILPYAKSGIIAGVLLTLGRALGETLAVTMVIGNRNQIPTNIFQPAQTIASLIANEYGEASGLKQSSLIEAGIVLILITLLFSLLGRLILHWSTNKENHYKEGK